MLLLWEEMIVITQNNFSKVVFPISSFLPEKLSFGDLSQISWTGSWIIWPNYGHSWLPTHGLSTYLLFGTNTSNSQWVPVTIVLINVTYNYMRQIKISYIWSLLLRSCRTIITPRQKHVSPFYYLSDIDEACHIA